MYSTFFGLGSRTNHVCRSVSYCLSPALGCARGPLRARLAVLCLCSCCCRLMYAQSLEHSMNNQPAVYCRSIKTSNTSCAFFFFAFRLAVSSHHSKLTWPLPNTQPTNCSRGSRVLPGAVAIVHIETQYAHHQLIDGHLRPRASGIVLPASVAT